MMYQRSTRQSQQGFRNVSQASFIRLLVSVVKSRFIHSSICSSFVSSSDWKNIVTIIRSRSLARRCFRYSILRNTAKDPQISTVSSSTKGIHTETLAVIITLSIQRAPHAVLKKLMLPAIVTGAGASHHRMQESSQVTVESNWRARLRLRKV